MINVKKILENYPKGTRLWSDYIGECYFYSFSTDGDIITKCNDGRLTFFSQFGEYVNGSGLCNLFPSEEMQEWSKFAWKKGDMLKNGEKICFFNRWESEVYTQFISYTEPDSIYLSQTDDWEKDENATSSLSRKNEIIDICHQLLNLIDEGYEDDGVYDLVVGKIGLDNVIKYKHENRMELNQDEVDYLVSKL